jgi:hypothetical protein
VDRLAHHLNVDLHRVHFWRRGAAAAPDAVMVQLVDLVLKDDIARAHSDRRIHRRGEGDRRVIALPPLRSGA